MKKYILPILFFISILFNTKIMAQESKLMEVASFGKYQPIGVTVSAKTNRLFVSFPKREPYLYGLTEIVNGERKPFPDEEWNKTDTINMRNHFVSVQDLYADEKNFLWVLDSRPGGSASIFGSDQAQKKEGHFKLLQINLADNKVVNVYHFDDLPKDKSALNDIVVDHDKQLAYLSDPGLSAIVVLELKTGKSRTVLQKDTATLANPGFILHLDNRDVVDHAGKPFTSNVNGIALTHDNPYFYFRAINQTKLYRIKTEYLADTRLSETQISEGVEMVAETGVCHGMIADKKGNIYLSSSPDYSVKYVSPDGKLHTLVTDKRLSWPDSFGIGDDGYLYLSCAQLNRQEKYNKGKDRTDYPYRIYKVKLPE
ncbi:major royal jelly family protein [Pedobacter sp. AJM]|uniref:major royal jelly family protein n=1 Tax=Pedobacter sp. AJM TaxID=2003629 RepID=UPI000B669C38|nr:major royal jelly family protein [Pedobacter sp. AJM]OWK69167.1 gluconolactonase [Pedobacter sp. AJM]